MLRPGKKTEQVPEAEWEMTGWAVTWLGELGVMADRRVSTSQLQKQALAGLVQISRNVTHVAWEVTAQCHWYGLGLSPRAASCSWDCIPMKVTENGEDPEMSPKGARGARKRGG